MRLKGICNILRIVFLVELFALGFTSLVLGAAIQFRSQPFWTQWGLYCSRTYPKTFFEAARITMHGIETHGRAIELVGGTDS